MAKRKPATGDKIECPYCHRRGTIVDVFEDGSMQVLHRLEKLPTYEATRDLCYRGIDSIRNGERVASGGTGGTIDGGGTTITNLEITLVVPRPDPLPMDLFAEVKSKTVAEKLPDELF